MGSRVGSGRGVVVGGIIASVVATASSTGKVGAVFRLGKEQAVKINNNPMFIKNCLMHRLYSFSEQINMMDV